MKKVPVFSRNGIFASGTGQALAEEYVKLLNAIK